MPSKLDTKKNLFFKNLEKYTGKIPSKAEGLHWHWQTQPYRCHNRFCTKLTEKIHQDLEVEDDGDAEIAVLPLRAYRRMFISKLTIQGLPKPDALQSTKNIILESHADGILPVHGTLILKVTHYKTDKLKPIRFYADDTKNKIIYHVASTQLGLLKVLWHNRATWCRHLNAVRNTPCKKKTHPKEQQFALYA